MFNYVNDVQFFEKFYCCCIGFAYVVPLTVSNSK